MASSSSSSSSSSGGLPVCDDQNITTLWSYTADGKTFTLTALNSATGDQVTTYGYGTTLVGSDVARSDVLSTVTYPDGGVVSYLVNRQGQTKQFTDQRLVIHAYDFDLLGRQTEDRVISLGDSSSSSSSSSSGSSGTPLTENYVDDTVQRIARTYEVRGLLQNVTSYSSPIVGAGSVVNDVQRAYNSFGQLVMEYQEHSGAVNTSTSVSVQYAFADGSANTIRPTQLIYPSGRILYYDYGSSGAIDDALSRVASLIDSDATTHLVDYTRLGAGTFVQSASPQPQISWSLINGTGADPYTGLDQFSRVVDNRWYSTAARTDLDRIQHGYDRAGNRLWRRNTVAEAAGVYLDELYAYDGVNRLKEMQRGQLSLTEDSIVSGTLNFAQAWGLDATGNWSQFWQNETGASWNLQQSRLANDFNEISGIEGGGWASPAYDAAGNMIRMPQPSSPTAAYDAVYDVWNRITALSADGSLIERNAYDGEHRGIAKFISGTLRHAYFSLDWQSLEERLGASSSPDMQFVWDQSYVDGLVMRDRTSERLYAAQDSNWNLTGICDPSGAVSERYKYTPYGQPVFLNPDFAAAAGSAYGWDVLFGGYRWDTASHLSRARHRLLHFALGTWTTRDPIAARHATSTDLGSSNLGQLEHSLYCYGVSNPIRHVDPSGLVCAAAVHCRHAQISGMGIGWHCGLTITDNLGTIQLDGRGGDVGYITQRPNAEDGPIINDPQLDQVTGPFVNYPNSVCACLRAYPAIFNAAKVPRHTLEGNSNWALNCMLSNCGLRLKIGKRKPNGYFLGPCKEYRYVKVGINLQCICASRYGCPGGKGQQKQSR